MSPTFLARWATRFYEKAMALSGFTYPDKTGISNRDPDGKWGDSNRILTYTDGNGVVYTYDYDRYGAVRSIELSDGPTFHYQRDEGGNLLELQAAGMRVQHESWQEGLPSTMRWGDRTKFTITRDSDANLQRIADGNALFVLDLTWRAESSAGDPCDEGAGGDRRLQSVLRQVGTFSETLTPSYNDEEHLTGLTISHNSNGVQDVIEENYGTVQNQLLGSLTRLLNNQKLVGELLQAEGAPTTAASTSAAARPARRRHQAPTSTATTRCRATSTKSRAATAACALSCGTASAGCAKSAPSVPKNFRRVCKGENP